VLPAALSPAVTRARSPAVAQLGGPEDVEAVPEDDALAVALGLAEAEGVADRLPEGAAETEVVDASDGSAEVLVELSTEPEAELLTELLTGLLAELLAESLADAVEWQLLRARAPSARTTASRVGDEGVVTT
jgi:hypothetical protein